jgi:hypothetical protein
MKHIIIAAFSLILAASSSVFGQNIQLLKNRSFEQTSLQPPSLGFAINKNPPPSNSAILNLPFWQYLMNTYNTSITQIYTQIPGHFGIHGNHYLQLSSEFNTIHWNGNHPIINLNPPIGLSQNIQLVAEGLAKPKIIQKPLK